MLTKLLNPIAQCNLKFDSKKTGEFEGYASVYGNVDSGGDVIEKGAYTEVLAAKKVVKMFFNHNHGDPNLGYYKHLEEDSIGLFVAGKIYEKHRDGPAIIEGMRDGQIDGLSVGLRSSSMTFEYKGDVRHIKNVGTGLEEISVVNFPMNEQARITAVKNEILQLNNLKDAEQYLRDSGFSKSAALAFVSRIRNIGQSDSGRGDDETNVIKQLDVTNRLVNFINAL